MSAFVWVLALVLVGLAVMVAEVFIPSGGVLGFLSVVALGAAIVTAFLEGGASFGLAVVAMAFVAVPVVLALAFHWFPDTPLGRRVLPPPPQPDDVLPDAAFRRGLRDCVGRTGRVTSELMPWGRVEVDGLACDALSESGPIDAGQTVEVTAVQGAGLVVRVVSPRQPTAGEAIHGPGTVVPPAAAQPAGSAQAAPGEGSALSPTLETFDFETLDPPAA
jgi:membrane-bound ClpP family serine protease